MSLNLCYLYYFISSANFYLIVHSTESLYRTFNNGNPNNQMLKISGLTMSILFLCYSQWDMFKNRKLFIEP
jgi:hypothetical protein